jgi:thymidine kinase
VTRIPVEVLCWCGRAGQLNARVVDGVVARQGEQVVIGDTVPDADVR